MKSRIRLSVAVLIGLASPVASRSATCESLSAQALAGGKITLAEAVPAGDWKDPGGKLHRGLPAFCRVTALLSPSTGSAIRTEVWLPQQGWNGRLLGTGNGSYAGEIGYGALASAVGRGYAGANDDMGTAPARGMDGSPLIGQPVKWLDFGQRAAHEVALAAKQVVTAFYGKPPRHAYFVGCSTGGQQALTEAQRHPEDYDGIVAGCAANDRIALHASVVWQHRTVSAPGALPSPESIKLLQALALASCGAKDGVAGAEYLVDPSTCQVDPGTLECRGEQKSGCIPAPQVAALRALRAGPQNPRTGEVIFPGLPVGAESAGYLKFVASQANPPWDGLFRWVFGAGWDPGAFDFDRDLTTVGDVLGGLLDATSPDLTAFEKRGGKLILWHGWADPIVPAGGTLAYYQRVVETRGGRGAEPLAATRKFARLFLAPGVRHCAGGPGPDGFGVATPAPSTDPEHDAIAALARWVEQGIPPDRIVATKYLEDDPAKGIAFQRPLCPYPKVARARGPGLARESASFTCEGPPPPRP